MAALFPGSGFFYFTPMTYAEKLKTPTWQKRRLRILERDEWKCQMCLDSETTLHVHHKSYGDDPLTVSDIELITVCEDCHTYIEYTKHEYITYETLKVASSAGPKFLFGFCKSVSNNLFYASMGTIENGEYRYVISFSEKTLTRLFDVLKEIKEKNG